MAIFPHLINTASCATPHQHRIPSSPERLQRERRVVLEFLSGFKKISVEQNLNLRDLSIDEIRLIGRAIDFNSGLLQGLVAGALTLVTLRRGPIYMTRYLQKYHHHHSGPILSKSNKAPTSVANSPFQPNSNIVVPPNESPLMKAGWWLIDLTLSCAVAGAVMAATATTNQEELFMTLSQIPRVPESRIADSFCPQAMLMLQDMKNRKRSDDTAAVLESPPQSVMLQAMMDFTRACQQRENRKRNREQGMMNDDVNDDAGDFSLFGTTDNGISTTSNWDDTRG